MKKIRLSKRDIKDMLFDTIDGYHVLAVSPDASDYAIYWKNWDRIYDPWPKGWLVISIPALNPDGSGSETEEAFQLLESLGLREEAEQLMEAENIGPIEAVERLAPQEWKIEKAEKEAWLLEAFISACNGDGTLLNDPSPWGPFDPPALFEWRE